MTAQDGKLGRLIKRIAEFFKGIINSLKGESEPYYLKEVRRIADKFNALYEKEYASQNKKGEGKVKYSIERHSNGWYVKADRQVIYGDTKKEMSANIQNYINDVILSNGDMSIIGLDGDEIVINGRTAWKIADVEKLEKGIRVPMADEEYAVKAHAGAHIDELLEVSKSTNIIDEDTSDHEWADYFEYRYAYFEDYDGKNYRLTITVGINPIENAAYNIGKIRSRTKPSSGSSTRPSGGALSGSSATDNNISQPEPIVNTNSTQNSGKNASSSQNNSGRRSSKQKITPAAEESAIAEKETTANTEEDLTYTERVKKNQSEGRKALFEKFSVPVNARSEVSSLLVSAYSTIDRGGTVSERVKKVIYDTLVENSVVVDDSSRKKNIEFIEYFKDRTLRIDDGVLSEFSGGSWPSAFGKVAGKFKLARNSGSDISTVYREACELYPGLLYPFSDNASDQLQEIVDVLNSLKPEKMGILESAKRDNISEEKFIEFLEANLEEYRVKSGIAKLEKGRPISNSEIDYLASNHADEVSAALGIHK